MNDLAERWADQSVGSIFLYTNEAHPGEHYPHITSMEQKFEHARALIDVYGVHRPIVLDAFEGACHQAYGGMPNMTWIINRSGRPVYKADWTDAPSVGSALEHVTQLAERRRQGARLNPFLVERLDYRVSDRDGFYAGLEKSGPKAVDEYDKLFGSS